MLHCKNCGKELSDDAAFCSSCGKSTAGEQTESTHSAPPTIEIKDTKQNTYYPPQGPTQPQTPPYQGQSYNQPPQKPSAPPYYPGGPSNQGYAPNQYQQNTQSSPYYQGVPYGGGPNYPKKPGGNKALIIVIVVIIALVVLIGGAIIAINLIGKDSPSVSPSASPSSSHTSPKPSSSIKPSPSSAIKPTPSASAKPSASTSPKPSTSASGSTAVLAQFDNATQTNIKTAFSDISLDIKLVKSIQQYKDWISGAAYTFTYKNTVLDLLLYQDGDVFSVETNGVQVYLAGYEPYNIEDYLGGTKHYDEIAPDSGYFFFNNSLAANGGFDISVGDSNNYVVELIDASSGSMVSAFYMTAGTPLTTEMPSGTYTVKFAVGTAWQDVDYLFGTNTTFYKLNSPVTVSKSGKVTLALDVTGSTGAPYTQITVSDFN